MLCTEGWVAPQKETYAPVRKIISGKLPRHWHSSVLICKMGLVILPNVCYVAMIQ